VMHQREFIKLLHLLCVTVPDLKVAPIVGVLVSKIRRFRQGWIVDAGVQLVVFQWEAKN